MSNDLDRRYQLVDTWSGGTRQWRIVLDNATKDECVFWIHDNTSFSLDEATRRQGYMLIAKMTPEEQRADYEQSERTRHMRELAALEREPLADRRAARAEWLAAMRDHRETVRERARWLFAGMYGWAEQEAAERIAANRRMNQTAALGQLVAAVEWRCPSTEARKAWLALEPADQIAINSVLADVIEANQS